MNSKGPCYPVFIVAFLIVAACENKKEEARDHNYNHTGHDESSWREMDEFHMIMAETFHPYKDSTNLEPVKRRASELMTAASQWASATLPEKVDSEEVRDKLERLRSEAALLAESVRSADDNVIGEQLTQLHDTFHEIQEVWYGGH